jgi:hypothetical protein
MPGHSEHSPLSEVLWPDAEVQSISIDYHDISIQLVESTGRRLVVIGSGYIGYQLTGFWDEVVVERAELSNIDPFLDECLRRHSQAHGRHPSPSGDPTRNLGTWKVLIIHFSDGIQLRVAAAQFSSREGGTASAPQ